MLSMTLKRKWGIENGGWSGERSVFQIPDSLEADVLLTVDRFRKYGTSRHFIQILHSALNVWHCPHSVGHFGEMKLKFSNEPIAVMDDVLLFRVGEDYFILSLVVEHSDPGR